MISEDFCKDNFWNTSLTWDPENPDLTFCFKNSALIWVPCGFLWLFSPLDIYRQHKSRYNHIPYSVLNILKFLFICKLIVLCFIDLAMMITVESRGIEIYGVQFVSIGVKILTFSFAAYLQMLHKSKGHRASKFLFIFWFAISFFALPQLRWEIHNFNIDFTMADTFWHSYHFFSFASFFTLIWLMTIASAFCDKPPDNSSYPKSDKSSPELAAGALNQLFFSWFTKTTWMGWKRPLTEADIFEVNPQFASNQLVPVFDMNFKISIEKNSKKTLKSSKDENMESNKTNGKVLVTLWRSFGGELMVSLLLRIIIDLLQFSQPFLLAALIAYVSANGALWKGLLLTFTFFGVSFILALMNGQQMLIAYHVGVKIRTTLISAIYRKALKISSSAKKNTTVGEIVNLMAVDAHRFFEMSPYILIGVTAPLVMGLALYFLYFFIGVSAFAGLAVLILMFPVSGFMASRLQTLQYQQMSVKDERVKSISEILAGIKVIKFYAWEPSFQTTIAETREKELKYLKGAAVLNAGTEFIWTLTPFLVSFVTFTTYVMLGNALTADIAFVSIVLFNILRLPMTMLPITINFFMMAWVSVKRLNKFMNSNELNPDNVKNDASEFALSIKDGNFAWVTNDTVLKNINLEVKKGSLTAVVGVVGSGKSSLISALLGEMEKLGGKVNVDGRLAFVSQLPWIQNATLMNNILFGKTLDKEFYEKVIYACALTSDLTMLPAGDQTEIGEKGINLSGGQKQRVALARAVYSRADIYILDDPLSAVDSHVGKHIFENILGQNGLLKGKTRFLITHAISYLPKVDEILVMKDGEITESGSYRQLLAQKGAFSEFLLLYLLEHSDDEDLADIKNELKVEDIKLIMQRSKSRTAKVSTRVSESQSMKSDTRRRTSRTSNRQNEESSATVETTKSGDEGGEQPSDTLIESESAAVGSVAFGVYARYFKSIGSVLIAFVFIFALSSEASAVMSNFWIALWVSNDDAATDNSVRNFFVAIYGTFGLLLAVTYFTAALSFAFGAIKAARNLHSRLLYNILRLPLSFFDTTPLGRIVNRFSRDTDMIDCYLPPMLFSWVAMFFNVIGTIFVISYSTPWFLVVVIPLSIAYYLFQKFYIATSRQLKRLESITRSPIYSHFSESVSGQSIIRAYKEEKRFTVESETKVDHNQGIAYQSLIADMWLGVRLEIVGAFIVLFACLFAILERYDIEEATVGLSISYALQISAVLSYFVMISTEVETNIVSVERVEEYADLPQEAPWKNSFEVDEAWPTNGIIEFNDFEVRYRTGLELILKGISFTCKSQEKIGIVGRTGAGKSSMTLSLFRIIEAAGGKIVIDGINIANIGLHSLRNRLTIIPQDPVLFSGSLRMNIDPFSAYTDDEIWIALEHAHLKAFVKTLPEGLTHKVSEGGENMSVGQRQLVCLARALLRKTKVLILDEATAAIDIETDELIQKTIRAQFSDCTILTIAHRLNTILDSDRIIVLEHGKIAEFDTPSNLLADSNSLFYGMAKDAGIVE